jgi:translation initiation factor 2 beta subunit (eIF-2beta)/eIF-5
MKVNIPKSNIDTFFRYKRDEIEIKVINTNGGNTELINIITIAEQLGDAIELIIKYIKKKCNTNIIIKNDKYVINKILTKNDLEIIIEEYIKNYILCKSCLNPEFNRIITKKEEKRTCKACGSERIVI